MNQCTRPWIAAAVLMAHLIWGVVAAESPRPWPGDAWRRDHRIIDLHMHINGTEEHVQRALRIMDRVGVGIGVNLSGGTVTVKADGTSDFERIKALGDRLGPNRFVHYFNLDYREWDTPDFVEKAVRQVETAHRLGAAGLKEFKRLGLNLRNGRGELIRIDDPKLDGVWARCGELGMPVSIHVADPKAFWLPYNQQNERWKELKDHKSWWFGDPKQYPTREELLAALDRVIARHPKTTFVCVHFANNSEDIDWVERKLDERPNMNADLAARIPELGRHDPEKLRKLFTKHQDRIFFATDFQVYQKLILGSSGDAEQPSDDDAVEFYTKEWRWLETLDRDWPHMTPIQGDWNINSIGLTQEVLRKIYFGNAQRLLARTLPTTRLKAHFVDSDFKPDGRLREKAWKGATPLHLERQTQDGRLRPELSTTVRALWSKKYLYLAYECPFSQLTHFGKSQPGERIKSPGALWDKDVVEAFIAPDPGRLDHYTEYEWAPNNDALDLRIRRPEFDFNWTSGMEWKVRVDERAKIWVCEVRIPLTALSNTPVSVGTNWRANIYRIDRHAKALLAMNPTLNSSFHTPERFGWIDFVP